MGNIRLAKPQFVRSVLLGAVALANAIGLPGNVSAQTYPVGPVRMVVPFPSGGPLDFVSRLLAERLSIDFKQPFVVDNRSGAAGNIGTEAVAKAAPNGQTLLVVIDTPLTVNKWLYKKLPFDPEKDFIPISIAAGFYQMLVVHPSVPVGSLMEAAAQSAVPAISRWNISGSRLVSMPCTCRTGATPRS
jgi:tripartite-type tricarboxylate transporter receptor subunit TctC